MKFEAFERAAREAYDEIPEPFKEGIDGLTIRREATEHPELPGIYTLGECLTEEHLSDFGSAETTRSVLVLYWGSFRALARDNPDFDWDEEIWETVTHELRHHLESLAGDDALEDVDYAANETFKRFEGQDFDPWYWQRGEREGEGVYRVEKDWYVEVPLTAAEFEDAREIEFEFARRRWRIARPDVQGDLHFVLLEGIELRQGSLELVLVRRRGWWEGVRDWFGSRPATVLESEATTEPADAQG